MWLRDSADEAAALAGYQHRRDRALRDVFDLTCAMAGYPPVAEFVALQKRLARAVDVEATELAARPVPGGRALACAHAAPAADPAAGD